MTIGIGKKEYQMMELNKRQLFVGIGAAFLSNFLPKNDAYATVEKSLPKQPSSEDLMIMIKECVEKASKRILFEPNNMETREKFNAEIIPFLENMKKNKGIYDYHIVTNHINNKVDSNELVSDLLIKPNNTISYIHLNTRIQNNTRFTEIQL